MCISDDYIEEIEDFLGGTFHQDISSPEEAIDEFILESSKDCLQTTINYCEAFLNSQIETQEKESIIQENAEIYFSGMGLTPLQWFTQLVEHLKKAA